MADDVKPTQLARPAKKQRKPTAEELLQHAQAIIKFDRDMALKSQRGVDDLVNPSQDSRQSKPVSLARLEDFCGAKPHQGVIVESTSEDSDKSNVVPFSTKKKI
jgi:hypothetical protein